MPALKGMGGTNEPERVVVMSTCNYSGAVILALFKPYYDTRAKVATVLLSDMPVEDKIDTVFGADFKVPDYCGNSVLNIDFEALHDTEVVRIIAATTVAAYQYQCVHGLYARMYTYISAHSPLLLRVRRGLILGLLEGANRAASLRGGQPEAQDGKMFGLLQRLIWVKGEDIEFSRETAGTFNNEVTRFLNRMSTARARCLASFLEQVATEYSKTGGYPSLLAKQVVTEFVQQAKNKVPPDIFLRWIADMLVK
ncbi:MAG: hypothetical protein Q8P86_02505 [bacterium]|nr:hypothetical protein [bacterium]